MRENGEQTEMSNPLALENLVSVTTGNIFGGGFVVAATYWFIYLRPREVNGRSVPKRIVELFLAPLMTERSREQK